jgi:hypothetical protein
MQRQKSTPERIISTAVFDQKVPDHLVHYLELISARLVDQDPGTTLIGPIKIGWDLDGDLLQSIVFRGCCLICLIHPDHPSRQKATASS